MACPQYFFDIKNPIKSTIPPNRYPAGYIEDAAWQTIHQITTAIGPPQWNGDHGEWRTRRSNLLRNQV